MAKKLFADLDQNKDGYIQIKIFLFLENWDLYGSYLRFWIMF